MTGRICDSQWRMASDSYHHGDLKSALLRTGLQIVDAEGAAGLTLQKAASRHGVSAPAVYRHYASKEELLAAIAAEGFHMLRRALEENLARRGMDSRIFFRRSVESYIELAISRPHIYELMFGGIIPDPSAHPELRVAGHAAFEQLLATIRRCQQDGLIRKTRPLVLAFHVWSQMHGFVMLQLSGQNPLVARDDRQMRNLVGMMVQLLRQGLDAN